MKKIGPPVSSVIVLAGMALLFVYLSVPGASADVLSSVKDLPAFDSGSSANSELTMSDIMDYHSSFQTQHLNPRLSIMQTEDTTISDLIPPSSTSSMTTLDGEEQLDGLVSMNTNLERGVSFEGSVPSTSSNINYMNIEVRGITVIAMNTVKGGSAVATSNIILQPVQTCGTSELNDKLR